MWDGSGQEREKKERKIVKNCMLFLYYLIKRGKIYKFFENIFFVRILD